MSDITRTEFIDVMSELAAEKQARQAAEARLKSAQTAYDAIREALAQEQAAKGQAEAKLAELKANLRAEGLYRFAGDIE